MPTGMMLHTSTDYSIASTIVINYFIYVLIPPYPGCCEMLVLFNKLGHRIETCGFCFQSQLCRYNASPVALYLRSCINKNAELVSRLWESAALATATTITTKHAW